ncbi:MAG TPA: SUF system Fe-S cluster assembly protein [Candidatus Acidoferrales bacterium]|nr:SUF system Fe-S cluster assembly protein [Candidatus Acidoferrales bacterium]
MTHDTPSGAAAPDPRREAALAALRRVYDPEMPVNIYELGLIYGLEVDPAGVASVRMTLTAPNCPVAGTLPGEVERAVRAVPGVTDVKLELTFDPPWSKDRMSEAAKLALGIEDIIPIARLRR